MEGFDAARSAFGFDLPVLALDRSLRRPNRQLQQDMIMEYHNTMPPIAGQIFWTNLEPARLEDGRDVLVLYGHNLPEVTPASTLAGTMCENFPFHVTLDRGGVAAVAASRLRGSHSVQLQRWSDNPRRSAYLVVGGSLHSLLESAKVRNPHISL